MQVIYTLDPAPKDMEKFFETFIKQLLKKEVQQMGTIFKFSEIGPREGYSSVFTIIPAMNTPTEFKVMFNKSNSKLEAFYESKVELAGVSTKPPKVSVTTTTIKSKGKGRKSTFTKLSNMLSEKVGVETGSTFDNLMGNLNQMMSNMMVTTTQGTSAMMQNSVDTQLIPILQDLIKKSVKKMEEKKEKKEKKKDKDEPYYKKTKDPMKLLKLKFVSGEISEEEYLRKKEILKG